MSNSLIKFIFISLVISVFLITAVNRSTVQAVERTVFVHLFEWKWTDIANECENWLGPKGYGAVQISPPHEHLVLSGGNTPNPWWQRYQAVSYKLDKSRSGTRAELEDMVTRCNNAGVKVYADIVMNHMTGAGVGSSTGSAGTFFNSTEKSYPGVPYGTADFHPNCDISASDYANNPDNVIRNCRLESLLDLDTGKSYVQQKIADYMNDLLSIGVRGFRIDAMKHVDPTDITGVLSNVNDVNSAFHPEGGRPYIFQEVIDLGGEDVKGHHYIFEGKDHMDVTEFKYGRKVAGKFRDPAQKLADLETFPGHPGSTDWGLLASPAAVAFIDNHDNQRGHGSGSWGSDGRIGSILSFHYDGALYKLANVFMLAWPYGYPRVMSSYEWPRKVVWVGSENKHKDLNDWAGPPSDGIGNTKDAICFRGEWICEHRWGNIANMVAFRNYTSQNPEDWTVTDWWDNDKNQIAFGRNGKGFVVINRGNNTLNQSLKTGLPPGDYCDVLKGNFDELSKTCSGPSITVTPSGSAHFTVHSMEASAIHVGALISPLQGTRTVVFMFGKTEHGQDMFLRGGIDHDHAVNVLGRTCATEDGPTYECSMPIRHNNLLNDTTRPWREGDNYLDWYDQREPDQNGLSHGILAVGTAADWTTNNPGHGATVAVNGFGFDDLNKFFSLGDHYWMMDVDMDCSKGVQFGGDSWFEFKSYVSNAQNGWEGEINQSGTPYTSKNHFAKCGKINIFSRNSNAAAFHDFP